MIFGFDTAAARRYAELINRLLGVESGDIPLPPGFILELDRPEWRIHKREFPWTTTPVTIAPASGNVSRLQIHNPLNSQRITVVEGFVVCNIPQSPAFYAVQVDSALAGTPTPNLALDTRAPVSVAGTRKVGSLNRIDNSLPAPSGQQYDRREGVTIGNDVIFNYRVGPMQPIILAPNTTCEVVNLSVNTILTAIGFGYDRPATPDELAQ